MNPAWKRVTKSRRCLICARPDDEHQSVWCGYAKDGSVSHCMFTPSPYKTASGGWLHFRDPLKPQPQVRRQSAKPIEPWCNWDRLVELYQASMNGQLVNAAASLGVSLASLKALRAGWDGEALTFPMHDAKWQIIGIRRRLEKVESKDDRQRCTKGSHPGIGGPAVIPAGPMWITEGPTDCAALVTLGLNALWRPSCSGGVEILKLLTAGRTVTIVGDNDTPDKNGRLAGQSGALALGRALIPVCESMRVMFPPDGVKDAREWLRRGAKAADFR